MLGLKTNPLSSIIEIIVVSLNRLSVLKTEVLVFILYSLKLIHLTFMIYKPSIKYLLIMPIFIFLIGLIFFNLLIILFSFSIIIFLYIKILFIKISLKDDKIDYKSGVFFVENKEIFFSKINRIDIKQNLIQKLLKTGTIVVYTGNDIPLVLESIDKFEELKNNIKYQKL